MTTQTTNCCNVEIVFGKKKRNRYITWRRQLSSGLVEWDVRFRPSPKDCTDWVATCPTRSLARKIAGYLNKEDIGE